jgi:hypothetical protein
MSPVLTRFFQRFYGLQRCINHVRLINLMSRGNSNSNLWKDKYVNASSDKALNIFYDHLIALEKELSAAMLVQVDHRAQRKASLERVLARAEPGLRFNEHLDEEDGPLVFHHACKENSDRVTQNGEGRAIARPQGAFRET